MKQKPNTSPDSDLPEKLAQPARRALAGAGIQKLADLTAITEADLKKLHGIGPNAVKQIRSALHEKGLSFSEEKKPNA